MSDERSRYYKVYGNVCFYTRLKDCQYISPICSSLDGRSGFFSRSMYVNQRVCNLRGIFLWVHGASHFMFVSVCVKRLCIVYFVKIFCNYFYVPLLCLFCK